MGKASDNERVKMAATYLNNIAVGLALGGGLLPVIAVINATEPGEWLTFSRAYIPLALVSLISVMASAGFRILADRMLKNIKD